MIALVYADTVLASYLVIVCKPYSALKVHVTWLAFTLFNYKVIIQKANIILAKREFSNFSK